MRDGAISTSVQNIFLSLLVDFAFFKLYPQKVTSHLLCTRGNIFSAILLLEMKNRDRDNSVKVNKLTRNRVF